MAQNIKRICVVFQQAIFEPQNGLYRGKLFD